MPAKYRHCKHPGHIPEVFKGGVGEVLGGHGGGPTLHFTSLQMGKRSGQYRVSQFNRTRNDAIRLTVAPDKAHDLIDKVWVP